MNTFPNLFLITTEAKKRFCIVSLLHWINKSWLPQFLVGNDNSRCGIWSELDWIYSEYHKKWHWLAGNKGPNVIKETVLIMMAFILWLQKSNGHFLCNVVRIPSCGRHEHALLRSSTFLSCDLLCTLRQFDKRNNWYFSVFLGHKTNPLIMNHPHFIHKLWFI